MSCNCALILQVNSKGQNRSSEGHGAHSSCFRPGWPWITQDCTDAWERGGKRQEEGTEAENLGANLKVSSLETENGCRDGPQHCAIRSSETAVHLSKENVCEPDPGGTGKAARRGRDWWSGSPAMDGRRGQLSLAGKEEKDPGTSHEWGLPMSLLCLANTVSNLI